MSTWIGNFIMPIYVSALEGKERSAEIGGIGKCVRIYEACSFAVDRVENFPEITVFLGSYSGKSGSGRNFITTAQRRTGSKEQK